MLSHETPGSGWPTPSRWSYRVLRQAATMAAPTNATNAGAAGGRLLRNPAGLCADNERMPIRHTDEFLLGVRQVTSRLLAISSRYALLTCTGWRCCRHLGNGSASWAQPIRLQHGG